MGVRRRGGASRRRDLREPRIPRLYPDVEEDERLKTLGPMMRERVMAVKDSHSCPANASAHQSGLVPRPSLRNRSALIHTSPGQRDARSGLTANQPSG